MQHLKTIFLGVFMALVVLNVGGVAEAAGPNIGGTAEKGRPSVGGTAETSRLPQSPTVPIPPAWSQRLSAKNRFELVLKEAVVFGNYRAVLDNETGLVWERSPASTTMNWTEAVFHCYGRNVSGRMGWRLPGIEELTSLVATNPGGPPHLPSGHPFNVPLTTAYWASTTLPDLPSLAFLMSFGAQGFVDHHGKTGGLKRAWCVRGGLGYNGP